MPGIGCDMKAGVADFEPDADKSGPLGPRCIEPEAVALTFMGEG
jgi:hypothetical protein